MLNIFKKNKKKYYSKPKDKNQAYLYEYFMIFYLIILQKFGNAEIIKFEQLIKDKRLFSRSVKK